MNDDKFETYSKMAKITSAKGRRSLHNLSVKNLSFMKLGLLVCMSLAFCVIGPFSILAPIPLAMAFLLYGYTHAVASIVVIVILGFLTTHGLSEAKPEFGQFFNATLVVFIGATSMAFATTETIRKKMTPVKGYIKSAATLFIVALGIVWLFHMMSELGLPHALQEKLTIIVNEWKQNPEFDEALKKEGFFAQIMQHWEKAPDKVALDFVYWLPSTLFVVIFLGLWLVHFVVLRNSLIWRQTRHYPFGINDFLNFKTPDLLIYALIIGLVFLVGGEMMIGRAGVFIGGNILFALATLYFIQGFGVYLEFLKFTKVVGIMRTLLVAFTVMFAYQFLVLVGLFDVWFDFRRFFKKKTS